jgi:hypothetical protein
MIWPVMMGIYWRWKVEMASDSLYPIFLSLEGIRASPRVCQNLLDKSCVLPTSKKLCKVKKEFISNSLT